MPLDKDGQRTPGCTCGYCVAPFFIVGLSDDPYRLELLPSLDGMSAIRFVTPVHVSVHAFPREVALELAASLLVA